MPKDIKSPKPQKSIERQFAEKAEDMIKLMSRLYKNQVLEELNQSTINKFEDAKHINSEVKIPIVIKEVSVRKVKYNDQVFIDKKGVEYNYDEYETLVNFDSNIANELKLTVVEKTREEYFNTSYIDHVCIDDYCRVYGIKDAKQVGNYAAVFLKIAKKVSKNINDRFDNDRIDALSKTYLMKSDKYNQTSLYNKVEDVLGINTKQLIAKEGLTFKRNGLILETSQWMKKLRDETLELYTANSLRVMSLGKSLEDVLKEFEGMEEKRKNHAKFTARNQINNFNSLMTKNRSQSLGITKAKWKNSQDARVRGNPSGKYPNAEPSHWHLEDKEFDLNKGLKVGGTYIYPGAGAFGCRCTYELIIPTGDEG